MSDTKHECMNCGEPTRIMLKLNEKAQVVEFIRVACFACGWFIQNVKPGTYMGTVVDGKEVKL